jgi:curved DNA-binding protein CbpA
MLRSSEFFGQIDMGICKYNANDHYAVLGVPVTADAATIRRRYLSIAKSLHPDIYGRQPADKEKATQVFAKIVSPAYNTLMHERERVEYAELLKLIAKRLMKGNQRLQPESEIARKLLYAPTFNNYQRYVKQIADVQYQDLDRTMIYVSNLSELNLVYLAVQEGYKHFSDSDTIIQASSGDRLIKTPTSGQSTTQPGRSGAYATNATNYNRTTSTPASNTSSNNTSGASGDKAKAYGLIKQAETYISQKQWGLALKELRNALNYDRSSSKCYALLGLVYMYQKQNGMAKVSFQQALKINPKEPIALKYIGKLSGKATTQEKKKGGFFNWLGGQ